MKSLFVAAAIAALPGPSLAQVGHTMQHETSAAHGSEEQHGSSPRLQQVGDAAFAAIQEAVAALESDSATDWSKVDIERLRNHLIDMNNVTLRANVETVAVEGGARMTVTGQDGTTESIRRMLINHAATMDGADRWKFVAAEVPQGAVLQVTGRTDDDAVKIRALGLSGLLARGDHHRKHHFAIASGQLAH